jgi:hypothetical protein
MTDDWRGRQIDKDKGRWSNGLTTHSYFSQFISVNGNFGYADTVQPAEDSI